MDSAGNLMKREWEMKRGVTAERLVTKERERMSLYIVFTHGSIPVPAALTISSRKMAQLFPGAYCLGTAVLSAIESD